MRFGVWHLWWLVLVTAAVLPTQSAEPIKRSLDSWLGTTPDIDGVLSTNEWSDATHFTGVKDWIAEFSTVTNESDLALRGWVKHDQEWLCFAFDITDDVLYGLDTPLWLPKENGKAHELTREGYPWFGDEMEILINAPNTWVGNESVAGNGVSWQMVCNLTKSRLGGVGVGGLLEGEPRTHAAAWATYQKWIQEGAQKAAVKAKPGGKGYVLEWAVRFKPCVEIAPDRFYTVEIGERVIGLNIALGDLDHPEQGAGNFGNFHHEQWFAGARHTRTQLNNFGTLRLMGRKPR